jgi:hypothetical protein
LLPTEEDYERVFNREAHAFAETVVKDVAAIVEQARAQAGEIVSGCVSSRISVRVAGQDGGLQVAVKMQLYPGDEQVPPAGLLASVRTSTQVKSKRRQIVVAKGKTTIAGGQSGPVKMKLTKAGIKLLGKQGSLKIAVLVTITIPGQKKIVEHRQVTVVLKKTKKKRVAA